MMKRALAAVLVFGAVLSVGPASAQSDQDYAYCGSRATDYTPQQVIQGCNALLAQGRFDNENLAIIFSNRGNAYKRAGDLPSALSDHNQALRYNPRDGIGYYNRGNTYLDMGDTARALSDFNTAIQHSPEHAPAWYQRGVVYNEMGDYAQSIANYNQALALVPNDVDAHIGRGNSYLESRDYASALRDYDQAVRLSPNYAIAYYNRGLAYDRQQMIAEAMADYNHALQIDPRYGHAWGNRGHLKLDQGDYSGAIADINQALSIRETGVDYNNRGLAYVGLQDYRRAIPDFDNAARIDPDNEDYHNSRCWYRGVANIELTVAREACDRAIALAQGRPADLANNLDSRGLISLRQERYQDAYDDFDAAMRTRPGGHWAYGRGYAAYRLGRTEAARADFALAQQLGGVEVVRAYTDLGFVVPGELLGAVAPRGTPPPAVEPSPLRKPG